MFERSRLLDTHTTQKIETRGCKELKYWIAFFCYPANLLVYLNFDAKRPCLLFVWFGLIAASPLRNAVGELRALAASLLAMKHPVVSHRSLAHGSDAGIQQGLEAR